MNSLGVIEKKQTTLGKLLTYVKQVCFKQINHLAFECACRNSGLVEPTNIKGKNMQFLRYISKNDPVVKYFLLEQIDY